MMRPVTFATGVAFAACVLDPAMAFSVSGKAPLPLAAGRTAGLRSCMAAGPTMKVLTVNGKKLSKFEAMRFRAGRCDAGAKIFNLLCTGWWAGDDCYFQCCLTMFHVAGRWRALALR